MRSPGFLVSAIIGILILAGCSSSGPSGASGDDGTAGEIASSEPTPTNTVASTTTTSTIPAQPPNVRMPETTFAFVGQGVTEAVVVTDPNGDEVVIRAFDDEIPGFDPVTNVRGRIIGFDWEPTEPGEWELEMTATDEGGLEGSAVVRLIARNEPSSDMLLAMGDSIAAGFGRDRSDFAGSDECFRSESDSYGAKVFDALVEAGALEGRAEFLLTACASATAAGLSSQPTTATDENSEVVGDVLTQLERATLLNPTIVTLTVGAADVGLFDLEEFLLAGADQNPVDAVDEVELARRVEAVRVEVVSVFDALMTTTSAHVVLTTAFNPVASNPIGVDGCNGDCMVAASDRVVAALNEMLLDVAEEQREGRVSIARLDGEADVWEAPNGLGVDALRDGLGPFQGLVDTFTGGTTALCADDGGAADALISALDCAHPNGDGQSAIADVVTRVLLAI